MSAGGEPAEAGQDAPIFVVGVARSGTTLLASMLGAHPRLDCGPESRFFFGLERADVGRILRDPDWPTAGVELVASLRTNHQPTHEFYGISLDRVREYLAAREPSVPALLESLTIVHAQRAGKPRWVEKTTDHLVHAGRIRRHWPDGRIVRIVRDARDVALSLRSVPFGSPSVVTNLFFWADRDARSAPFFEDDRGSLTVRYEDLVTDPQAVLGRICEFVGETFDERMLSTEESARGVAGAGETWKEKARTTVDASRVESWRTELTEPQQRIASVVCGAGLARYGYPDARPGARVVALQPLTRQSTPVQEELLDTLVQRGLRPVPWRQVTADPGPDAVNDPVLMWGRPGQLSWHLGGARGGRLRAVARVVKALARARLRRRPVLWVVERTRVPRHRGVTDRAADLAARVLARRVGGPDGLEEVARRARTRPTDRG